MAELNETLAELESILEKLTTVSNGDNFLDVRVEVALFKPGRDLKTLKANYAGTKLIYNYGLKSESTHWSLDVTTMANYSLRFLKGLYPNAKLSINIADVSVLEVSAEITIDGVTYASFAKTIPLAICSALIRKKILEVSREINNG